MHTNALHLYTYAAKTAWLIILLCTVTFLVQAQHGYWQQEAHYKMDIDVDHTTHRFSGSQTLRYTNHSPDTLHRVFFHLYFNAFQPGSAMDVRSRSIEDPDARIGARIADLSDDEVGFHKITSLKQDGKKLETEVVGTVMEVRLHKPIYPGKETVFEMEFGSQVPVQIRRSGRDNSEGIDYTMTQWYPKLAEYDRDGWHTDPYVAREFHGVFGSFEVNIEIDARFTLAGTGVVQNPEEVGHGYARTQPVGDRIVWKFKAEDVHDFAWAADQEYRHITTSLENGTELHFFHRDDSTINENWEKLVGYTVGLFEFMNERFGTYPYPQFSVIQGGDGGMEYPMCTMISGTGSFGGLVSVTVHEAIHNWYYGILANNESKYPWMDEGFTTYAQNIVLDSLFERNRLNPHGRHYNSYIRSAKSGEEEPLTTPADHYVKNQHYGVNSYAKGCVFLHQLSGIVGQEAIDLAMKRYFNQWKFQHPTPTDFKRVVEKTADMDLDWYFDAWIGTTKSVDYGIHTVSSKGNSTRIELAQIGSLPMPVEVLVLAGDKREIHYIPIELMRNAKPAPKQWDGTWHQQADWPWTYPFYAFEVDIPFDQIERIVLNPFQTAADIDPTNDHFPSEDLTYPAYKQKP